MKQPQVEEDVEVATIPRRRRKTPSKALPWSTVLWLVPWWGNLLICPWVVLIVNSCIKVCLDLQADKSPRRSQGTLLPSSGEPKVSNPWNKCVMQEMI
jgi:hypothetical protein